MTLALGHDVDHDYKGTYMASKPCPESPVNALLESRLMIDGRDGVVGIGLRVSKGSLSLLDKFLSHDNLL